MSRVRRGFHRIGVVAGVLCGAASIVALGLSGTSLFWGSGSVYVGGLDNVYVSRADTLQDILTRAKETDEKTEPWKRYSTGYEPLVDRIKKHGNVIAEGATARTNRSLEQLTAAAALLVLAGISYLFFWTIGWVVSGFVDRPEG